MPGPPPPPPAAPPPMLAPPTPFKASKGGSDDRSALLNSIRQGKKLKKTVTNDKSAPIIAGKVTGSNNNSSSAGLTKSGSSSSMSSPTSNGVALGGLFAGGMPKLRSTGILGPNSFNTPTNNNNSNNTDSSGSSHVNSGTVRHRPDVPPQPKNFMSIQNELKKQLGNDSKIRGPPPPAPVRTMVDDSSSSNQTSISKTKSNGVHSNQTSQHSGLQINHSTLHRKVKSNLNLSSLDSSINMMNNTMNGHQQPSKPVVNHGKPNLAPKPPPLTGKPTAPPKKLMTNGKVIHRAQSMKSPRSPSPQSPDSSASAIKFGTVRNLSSVIGQSLANSTGNLSAHRQRPALNGRPTAPPPSVPPQQPPPAPPQHSPSPLVHTPPPPSKMHIVKPPSEAPPPPPTQAPPPPPHRTQPMRPPPAVPNSNNSNHAPLPPPRNSSITPRRLLAQESSIESSYHFTALTYLLPPGPYRNVTKCYSNRQAASKQQAPQPPHLQAAHNSARTWDTTASC